jgi:hypothetical protein
VILFSEHGAALLAGLVACLLALLAAVLYKARR